MLKNKTYFSHLFVKVANIEDFCKLMEILGLELSQQDDKYFRYQGENGFYIGVEQDSSTEHSDSVEINVYVPDVEKAYKNLKDRGFDVTKPQKMPWGIKHIFFTDKNEIKYSVHD